MRDDFTLKTKETIAKRVNYFCSNPDCRKLTTGPSQVENKSINIGVASHISAASKGGCRYNLLMSSEERKSVKNGIWLCQTCSKLIDSDEGYYRVEFLNKWKEQAEEFAKNGISSNSPFERKSSDRNQLLKKLESKMSELFSELRSDLLQSPYRREFVILSKEWSYWTKGDEFLYYFEEHSELKGKLQILQNHNLVREITYNNVERFILSEECVEYLTSYNSKPPHSQYISAKQVRETQVQCLISVHLLLLIRW